VGGEVLEYGRELTREEKAAIRALVTRRCANFDREYGCLPLGCGCYMLEKCWTGAYCRYFREAVLPLDPKLEAALMGRNLSLFQPCPVCGRLIPRNGKQRYCSPDCRKVALREQKRAHMRKKRGWSVEN